MPVKLASLLRRYKPERNATTLHSRPLEALIEAAPGVTKRVMLDTTAIIHGMAGQLPARAVEMLGGAMQFHCSVCFGEVAVSLGKLHPDADITAAARAKYIKIFERIPSHAVCTPSPDIWVAAGLVAGTLARTQNFDRAHHRAMLNDALVYLTAAKFGVPVLTENRDDFDLIQQVAGHGDFIWYDAVAAGGTPFP